MLTLHDLLVRLTSPQFLWIALWTGLGVFTVVLFGLLLTRWGKQQPVQKCTILSVWFHLLLVVYATSIQIVPERHGPGNEVVINLGTLDGEAKPKSPNIAESATPRVRELPTSSKTPPPLPSTVAKPRSATIERISPTIVKPPAADLPRSATSATEMNVPPPQPAAPPAPPKAAPAPKVPSAPPPQRAETEPRTAAKTPVPVDPLPAKESTPKTAPQIKQPATSKQPAAHVAAAEDRLTKISTPTELADLPDPSGAVTPRPEVPLVPIGPQPAASATRAPATIDVAAMAPGAAAGAGLATLDAARRLTPSSAAPAAIPARRSIDEPRATPSIYGQRLVPDRERVAAMHGGSAQTEAAVARALKWLAVVQDADGRWDAGRFGAGRESQALGHDRGGAGADADTGISGLALLAFLGAGHTHQRGDHQATVGRGLQFLLDVQHPNGNLGGNAELFAFMYCHGMAALALCEAFAMTGDEQLREPVERAIRYTLAAQNRSTGGWRYRPGDTGDLSQLGWQLMALKSADLGGIEIPSQARTGMLAFLQSVSSGSYGGLASYRPGEQVSRTMTAEALVCRQFLGLPRENPSGPEAGNFLLGEVPGAGPRNYYYWYYGTLGMYQLQGEHWRRWNEALTKQLVESQVPDGDLGGSWEANDVWGGYGGRIYSTALATLCLEVYYRYLPLYVEAANNGGTQRK